MAYKLNSSGYYVGSDGKKYDATSGWTVSKDGKTLTNSYTGSTVSDVGSSGSTTSKTSGALTSTGANASTPKAVASTSKSTGKSSPRTVTYTSGNSGSAKNSSGTISQATQTLQNIAPVASTVPQANYNASGITDQASALAAMMGNSQAWHGANATGQTNLANLNDQIAQQWFPGATRENGEWYYNGSPLYGQNFSGGAQGTANAAGQTAADNYVSNPAAKGLLSKTTAPDYIGGVFLELGDMGKSQPQTAYSLDGSTYNIKTAKGLSFLHDAAPGESMVGADGARFTKNEDGSLTVYKDGKTYIYGAGMNMGIYPEPFEYTPFDQTEMGQSLMQDYQALLDKVQNYDPFSYDPNTDPLYLQYADSYTRGGQRAMTDILGQLAARTGGMASSYAGSMAQQTYDQYMADLANKIPELQQLAYSMYVDKYNRDVGNYERMYGQFQDAYNRNMQDTQFKYNQYQDELANRWKNLLNTQDMYQQGRQEYNAAKQWEEEQKYRADETAYQREMDQKRFDLDQEQLAWDRDQAQKQAQQEQIDNLWDQVNRYGRIPQLSTVLSLGLTYEDYLEMVAQGRHSRAADASRYYSGV